MQRRNQIQGFLSITLSERSAPTIWLQATTSRKASRTENISSRGPSIRGRIRPTSCPGLGQHELEHAIFPIGHLDKHEVRKIAAENGLITADKKDSTGSALSRTAIFPKFLSEYLSGTPGDIVELGGEKKGEHEGLIYYTLGQRRGLGIGGQGTGEPWFVADKDLETNTLACGSGRQASGSVFEESRCFGNELGFRLGACSGGRELLLHSQVQVPSAGSGCQGYRPRRQEASRGLLQSPSAPLHPASRSCCTTEAAASEAPLTGTGSKRFPSTQSSNNDRIITKNRPLRSGLLSLDRSDGYDRLRRSKGADKLCKGNFLTTP